MLIRPAGLTLVETQYSFTFCPCPRGQKCLLALKQKNIKFDRHYESGLFFRVSAFLIYKIVEQEEYTKTTSFSVANQNTSIVFIF